MIGNQITGLNILQAVRGDCFINGFFLFKEETVGIKN